MNDTQIVFKRTGEPWIDLGIVATWDALFADGYQELVGGQWESENGEVRGILTPIEAVITAEHPALFDFCLAEVSKKIVDPSTASRTGKSHPFRSVAGQVLLGHVNQGLSFPANILDKSKFRYRTGSAHGGICALCNESRPTRDAGSTHLPLLVDPSRMLNVYSELNSHASYPICQLCALAGVAAVSGSYYVGSRPGSNTYDSVLIVPEATDLVALNEFLQMTRGIGSEGPARFWRNFGTTAFVTESTDESASTYLAFMLSIWNFMRAHAASSPLEFDFVSLSFHVMAMEKTGNTLAMRDYLIVPRPATDLGLIADCDQISASGKTWNTLQTVMIQLRLRRSERDYSVRIREDIARSIVGRRDVSASFEQFLYEWENKTNVEGDEDLNAFAMRQFVEYYEREVTGMTEDELQRIRSVGDSIGNLVSLKQDKSLLYRLRNARSDADILDALQHMLSRYGDDFTGAWTESAVPPGTNSTDSDEKVYLNRRRVQELAEALNPSNYRQIRALLGIYAMLRYIGNREQEVSRS